ncbi:MAG: hypothetical protein PF637_05970 [Spirochaetes bacterium]|jgi:hypothetical protein|nr:hypothetical protein [Spirochaetota bacterium]
MSNKTQKSVIDKKLRTANKLENYEIVTVDRSAVTGAEYNPRKITESARKKLKKIIRKFGLLAPITWNEITGNVVGGHQRLSVLDDYHKGKDYQIQVARVYLSERDEIEANILLNNPSAQGEWDNDLLVDIKSVYSDQDFEKDLLFDREDIDMILTSTGNFEEVGHIFQEVEEQQTTIADIEAIKKAKKEHREKAKFENQQGTSHNIENDDYYVTVVFNNNSEKHNFLEDIGVKRTDKTIKGSKIQELAAGKYKLRA